MNSQIFFSFLILVSLCLSNDKSIACFQVAGNIEEAKSNEDPPEKIEGEFNVKAPGLPGLMFNCTLQGSPIPQGGKRKFLLRVKNPSETGLQYDQIKVFCDCLEVKCDQLFVKPGEWLELLATYRVPTLVRSVKYQFELSFQHKGQQVGLVSINGDLQNTLAILSDGLYESNGPVSNWEIAILTSPPVENNRLKVELSKSLASLTSEITEKDGKAFVRVVGPETSLGVSGLSGQMKVFDPVLGLSHSSFLTFVKTPMVKVSPMFARFVDAKDRPGVYTTTFLVQAQNVSRPSEVSEEAPEKNRLLGVEVKSDIYDLQIKKSEISERVWRYDVFVNRSKIKKGAEAKGEEFSLFWTLDSTQGKLSFESNCYFLEKSK